MICETSIVDIMLEGNEIYVQSLHMYLIAIFVDINVSSHFLAIINIINFCI